MFIMVVLEKDPDCSERKFVEIKDLDQQIENKLLEYAIPEEFKIWAINYLNEVHDDEETRQQIITENILKRLNAVKSQLNQLIKIKISAENEDGALISEEEYLEQRKVLLEQRESLEEQIKESDKVQDQYMELTEKTFNFACYARYWFEQGDNDTKTLILKSLGIT